jgi:hypothetical protein
LNCTRIAAITYGTRNRAGTLSKGKRLCTWCRQDEQTQTGKNSMMDFHGHLLLVPLDREEVSTFVLVENRDFHKIFN